MPYRQNEFKAVQTYRTMEVQLPWYRFGKPYTEKLTKHVPILDQRTGQQRWVEETIELRYCRKWEIVTSKGRMYQYQLMNGFFVVFFFKTKSEGFTSEFGAIELWRGPDFGTYKVLIYSYGVGRHQRKGRKGLIVEVPLPTSFLKFSYEEAELARHIETPLAFTKQEKEGVENTETIKVSPKGRMFKGPPPRPKAPKPPKPPRALPNGSSGSWSWSSSTSSTSTTTTGPSKVASAAKEFSKKLQKEIEDKVIKDLSNIDLD